jgi:uncharacterized protein DUF5681
MPEISSDSPASACFLLHFESGIEQNQALAPDLFRFSVGDEPAARDRDGRFAKGQSGNPRGRPRGISSPRRRTVTLAAWRENPDACKALFRRQPSQLRHLLRKFLPPASARDPAERIGLRLSSIRTPEQARRAIKWVWAALARGDLGTAEAARIARRLDARLRAEQRHIERAARVNGRGETAR